MAKNDIENALPKGSHVIAREGYIEIKGGLVYYVWANGRRDLLPGSIAARCYGYKLNYKYEKQKYAIVLIPDGRGDTDG